jgi:hypothetical protein
MLQTPDASSLMLTQVSVSTFIVGAMEWAKKNHHFTWINAESTKVNRAVAFGCAVFAAAGIHLSWSHGLNAGDYTIGIVGATPIALAHAGWDIFRSFMTQQLVFRAAVKPVPLAGQVTVPTKDVTAVVVEPPKGA